MKNQVAELDLDIELEINDKEEDSGADEEKFSSTDISETSLSYYMKKIANSKPLPKVQEQELGKRIQNGDLRALETLVNANLKFVIKVAYKFKNSGLPIQDIISQGNLGLMEAAKRYDPEKDVKFISYAVWWIRQYIVQGIAEQSGSVRLPIKQAGNLFKINNAKDRLAYENGHEASVEELSQYLDMKEEDISDILRVSKQALSLENTIGDGEDRSFIDYLQSKDESVENKMMKKNLQDLLSNMIDELDSREKQIINLRFGFENDEVLTLDEIGKKFGVSRERIRQLETRAMEKLKKKAVKKGLQFYLAV